MSGFRAKVRVAVLVIFVLAVGFAALYGLLKPISNGCTMTYMYPTYIPILASESLSSSKYGLYLYHEGWKKIDYREHLKKLNGVPVLFIPGNGGSYKQVRSLAAESHRAYQNGPLEHSFHQDASLSFKEIGSNSGVSGFQLPNKYASRLDWFAVDLEGEHSAMDGAILEEHTEYVVYAIHKILDQYRESFDARAREGAAASGSLPKSVILVGHSMGGFVARAATIHPHLRKSAVETVITLSTPHQSPPVAFQPSLGYYFARVNEKWKEGYNIQTGRTGHYASDPVLSHVVVVSISGGYNDYQVRTKLESLDNIVPPTHGFTISSTAMKNVWLSMEHQAILWCNQLVIQVSHTLLSLVDSGTGHPLPDTSERLEVFTRMLHSGISQNFIWMMQPRSSQQSIHLPLHDAKYSQGSSIDTSAACPSNIHWKEEGLERDLFIQTTTVTVLAMDGRRRWLDIQKVVSNGKSHFIFVTNLEPCSGVCLHLWPERGKSASSLPLSSRVLDVTSKLMRIPSGPAPRQMEPGSQTEQPPPTSVFWLGPEDMHGFRFLTISVAPLPTISGRPPPAASMAVGQFYNPKEGTQDVSSWSMLQSLYSTKEMQLNENHPLAFNLSFSMSLGLLPITLSLKTSGCGINNSGFPEEEAGDVENSRLCKLRCFPPVALAWDEASGLHIFPNLFSETIVVDSSPALSTSTSWSDKTTVVLLVDPHCSYKASITVSVSSAACRFLLLYISKIVGFSVAVIFFALMRQAYAWDLDLPIPSMLKAVESNLTEPSQFFPLAILPILFSLLHSFLLSKHSPPVLTFVGVSLTCYLLANGLVAVLILISHLVFYVVAILHVFLKKRCRVLERNLSVPFFQRFINLSSGFMSLKGVRVLRANPTLVKALSAISLACLVHPALGLILLVLYHILYCHGALCSFLTASFRSHMKIKEFTDSRNEGNNESEELAFKLNGSLHRTFSADEEASTSDSSKSFIDTQLDMFHHHHGLLTLHLIASSMFAPSLVAWLQRLGTVQSIPWILDSILCTGVILHGVCNSLPKFNSVVLSLPSIPLREVRLYFLYLIAGYWSYFSGMTFAPYRVFYVMAAIGVISFSLRILERREVEKGKAPYVRRKHSHRH